MVGAVRLFNKDPAMRLRGVVTHRDFCPVLYSLRRCRTLKRELTAALF